MILIFLSFIYIIFITFCWGYLIMSLLLDRQELQKTGFAMIMMLGLITLTTFGAYFSLFFRINWEFQIIIFLVAIMTAVFNKPFSCLAIPKNKFRISNFFLAITFSISALIIVNATSLTPNNPDTGIYHAQAIRWIETYPVVPGLANLHIRFGYNSSWLITNAIFSFPYLRLQSFHFMTGFLFILASIYFFSGIRMIIEKKFDLSDLLKTTFFLALIIFILDQSSSPGTDAPAAIMVWIIICESAKILEKKDSLKISSFYPILILTIFSLSVKLSTLPIMLLIIPPVIRTLKEKRYKELRIIISTIALFILPHMIRSLILTGYFIFPGITYDPLLFDWRLPVKIVSRELETIHWFAILPNSSFARFKSLSMRAWMTEWFLDLIPRHKALFSAVLFSPILISVLLTIKPWRDYLKRRLTIIILLMIIYLGVFFWFVSAPAFRFGYGFIVGVIALTLSLFMDLLLQKMKFTREIFSWMALPGIIIIMLIFTRYSWQIDSIDQRVILPSEYPSWPTAPCEFKNFTILCAQDYNSCWYKTFPCAVQGNPDVELRSGDFSNGFRFNP